MFKNLKRFISTALAITSVCACTATLTACETPHPEVEITLSFNDETYTLDYVLYRNITPATVNHFLALAENKYYDGLCVHDYRSDALYTGAYSYESEKLVYKNYFDTVASYIPQTVWFDDEKANPTYTLYGEFESNNFSVENGDLSESFGALVMYYSDKNTDYCVFATLKEGSVSVLQDLQTAIADYITDTYGEGEDGDFVTETRMEIDEDDLVLGGNASLVSYDVPNEPIVVTSVKVKKY